MKSKIIIGCICIILLFFKLVSASDHWVQNSNNVVPTFYWTCGCTPTAAAMVLGYYDWDSPTGRFFKSYGKLSGARIERNVIDNGDYHDENGNNYTWNPGSGPLYGTNTGIDTIPISVYWLGACRSTHTCTK